MMACVAVMMVAGTSLKAQEVTITLMPGWTWISIPSTETMDFATALGSFTPAVGDRIKSQWGNATYRGNGEWRGQISEFYPGYGYKYYSTRQVPVSVTFNAQQPTQQVVVTTDTPQFITGNSAMGGGEVTVSDGTYILVKGLCWAAHENPTTNEDSFVEDGSGVGSFSATITGLNWSTTYYVRAYAVTPSGTVYGEQQSFTTRDGIPTLTTDSITSITAISATCGGNITDDGGLSVTARGVCWSTSPNPTVSDSNTTNGTGTGSFTSSITELQIGTTYYVRAYATTNAGTGYGEQVIFTTRNGIPTVTTTEITNIEGTYANGGGNITDDGGLAVAARGVCWSTSPSPTLANSHTTNGSGAGSFSSYMIGLTMGTTYYVRAYATNSFVTVYGNQLSFTITNDEPAYVDLGLPSGLLWATCNVGADSPEEYGDYFAWGETKPKDTYDWSNYQYCNGSDNTLTKYCNDSDYGYSGFTDNLTTLLPEDDVATANWGSEWRMPTKEEWQELYQNTTHTWTTQDGVNGRLFTASNGNSIFLPAAGYRSVDELYEADHFSYYWSSSIGTNPNGAWYFDFDSVYYGVNCNYRDAGQSVRAVRSGTQNTAPTGAIDGKFTINSSGDQVYFSQGNLQYIGSAATPYWKFANNQWDILGTTTGQNSSSQNVDRDLFGWGTSGYHDANDPYNVNYQPWSTSTSQVNSSYNYYGYGPSTNMTDPNLTGTSANYDWGVYNPISNGGNQANQWRTLTQPEWAYVFNTRTTSSGIRYAKANVNNVNGVILLPDDWSSDTYSLNNTNSTGASFSSNTISASQWNTLEQAGAVFLPAAGDRVGTSVNIVGSYGFYWSTSSSGSYFAHYVFFYDSGLHSVYDYRINGFSVRLACVAEN